MRLIEWLVSLSEDTGWDENYVPPVYANPEDIGLGLLYFRDLLLTLLFLTVFAAVIV